MIVVTGARGFIGSNLVEELNKQGLKQLILVDEQVNDTKKVNMIGLKYAKFIERLKFLKWFESNANTISFVFHLGARTDTAEQDRKLFDTLNLDYSKSIFQICTRFQIPLIYASSAATYGDGSLGYDDEGAIELLKPLNPYGQSKQDLDLWVKEQKDSPPFWAGLKFFNVYGKHEGHKNRMASVIMHAFKQIKASGKMKLFQSHRADFKNGAQSRDFVSVKDLISICIFFYENQKFSGLYNVGTGKARTFNDLVQAVFKAMKVREDIEYIPTPEDIREAYQYFTEAKMDKLRKVGYRKAFMSLEEGVEDYIKNLLNQ
jgi:ADP-L-glycero-D-manno-heptose 6-epimerase